MMKKRNSFILSFLSLLLFANCEEIKAQDIAFKGYFYEKNERIELYLDLEEATLTIPGMSFLGKTNGYMQGNIYGVWMLTKYKTSGKKATLRFANDQGADAQTIKMTFINDSTLKYETVDGNHIKRVQKRKLVKIPNELYFTKIR